MIICITIFIVCFNLFSFVSFEETWHDGINYVYEKLSHKFKRQNRDLANIYA